MEFFVILNTWLELQEYEILAFGLWTNFEETQIWALGPWKENLNTKEGRKVS
jgi:hypothetical protein